MAFARQNCTNKHITALEYDGTQSYDYICPDSNATTKISCGKESGEGYECNTVCAFMLGESFYFCVSDEYEDECNRECQPTMKKNCTKMQEFKYMERGVEQVDNDYFVCTTDVIDNNAHKNIVGIIVGCSVAAVVVIAVVVVAVIIIMKKKSANKNQRKEVVMSSA